jgi:excisionase family DNA binding protein
MDDVRITLDKPWLSVADICEYMDVSTFVVTSVLRSGELPAVKFGREWRVAKEDFEAWLNMQRRGSRAPRGEASTASS